MGQAGSRSSINDVRVNTLMETKWGQSGHGENQYTPRGYVCGCVATAGAQIMRYWKYPTASITKIKDYYGTVDGTASWTLNDGYQTTAGGSYTAWNDDVKTFGGTYDWNNMPGTVSSWGMSTAQKKAIGKLTLDVGRSVYMDYADDGSGAHYSAFHLRLTDQFGYKNSALKINPSADEIKKGILCSLDLKSPCGVSVPGHAIVADGYGYNSGTLYVHFNFGWTGTDNAWYNPPDLTDADSDFTSIDTIIYNIYPPSTCSDSGRTIVSGRLLSNSGSILANTTVTARNRSSGATYTATTDSKGIYALLVPAASYTISATKDNCTASTNLTVQACSSTRLANDQGSSYYSGGTVANVHGVELTLNQLPAPTFSRANTVTDTTIFDGYVNLTISSSVSGATIRYTLDGIVAENIESEVAEITFNKLSPTGDLILNGGFEQNTVTQNSGVWSYSNGDGFSCKYWAFASNAGLAAPNCTWVANHSEFGGKAAFIQTNGAGSESFVAQEFVIPNAATYNFTFTYAARPSYVGVTTRALLIRGSVTNEIASVSPTATSPSEYSGPGLRQRGCNAHPPLRADRRLGRQGEHHRQRDVPDGAAARAHVLAHRHGVPDRQPRHHTRMRDSGRDDSLHARRQRTDVLQRGVLRPDHDHRHDHDQGEGVQVGLCCKRHGVRNIHHGGEGGGADFNFYGGLSHDARGPRQHGSWRSHPLHG